MNRNRITRLCAILFGAGAIFLQQQGLAQNQFEGVELTISHVAGSVYMISRPGGGGNIGAQIGPDGVLLVDALFAPLADRVIGAVREVTDEQIRFLINTHIHVDHIGGNEALANEGVLIFAHDNTRNRFLLDLSRIPRRGGTVGAAPPAGGRPVISFNDSISYHINGEDVLAFKAPPAHTDGDVFVYFPESDVLHLGDVFRTTSYPIIDVWNGGSLRGTIAALDKAIDIAGPNTKIIPGHGVEVVGKETLVEFRDIVLDVQNQVYTMINEGKKLEEVMAANVTSGYDAVWENDPGWRAEDFVPIVYYELGGGGRLADR